MEYQKIIKKEAGNKKIIIYPSKASDMPVIYLNAVSEEEGDKVYHVLSQNDCPDFSLVAISGLEWNHDMAPWDAAPVFDKGGEPFTQGADAYLKQLTTEIIPSAECCIHGKAAWRGLAGYSLAGLFAVYAMYHTSLFERIASISGSLWFPDFAAYAVSHEPVKKPKRLYFSLGDTEGKTKNPYLKTVQKRTEELEAFYRKQGIDTILCRNTGGHFRDTDKRTAAGILWILMTIRASWCLPPLYDKGVGSSM